MLAQALFGFELASADPRVAGINLVGSEDNYAAMADYADHMRIFQFVRGLYPKVHVSMHAGELALGLVPPEGLCCHVRQAVEVAGTDRIGHGVDVMYEEEPESLLKDMAAKQVLVEINLTSNEDVLGVSGKSHPFPIYRKFGVPVALSTDDEGIERIDLTNEYVRAVESYDLSYAELKQLVRNSLEYSFLTGPSLWAGPDFVRFADACGGDAAGADKPSSTCDVAFSKGAKRLSSNGNSRSGFRFLKPASSLARACGLRPQPLRRVIIYCVLEAGRGRSTGELP